MRKFSLLVSLFFILVACDTNPGGDEGSVVEPERGPLGKADAIGSCAASDGGDYCGGPSLEGNCWCDDQCDEYGDCCSDEPAVCDPEPEIDFCLHDEQCGSGYCDYEEACLQPDCDALVEAFFAETAEIRSCDEATDCDQVLTGTSCGCTRNWVARSNADIDLWETLRDDALEAGCQLSGTISTCDCPAADGFACSEGVCGWDYL